MNAITQSATGNLTQHQTISARWKLWTGRMLSILLGAFFLFDAVMKIAKPATVVTATLQARKRACFSRLIRLAASPRWTYVPRRSRISFLSATG